MKAEDYKIIILDGEYVTIVDKSIYRKIKNINWRVNFSGGKSHKNKKPNPYVRGYVKKLNKSVYLHRYITNCPNNLQIDHKNSQTLDNRLVNLEIVDNKENQRRKHAKRNNKN